METASVFGGYCWYFVIVIVSQITAVFGVTIFKSTDKVSTSFLTNITLNNSIMMIQERVLFGHSLIRIMVPIPRSNEFY